MISGITSAAAVSIAGGEYSINGGEFTDQSGSVTNGQTIRVRLTSSTQTLTSVSSTLTVGGVAGTFSVTTGTGPPAAPTAVTASAGHTSIIVKFGPPSSGGGAVAGYAASCTSPNGGVSGANTAGPNAASIVVGGLTTGKNYTCTVTANNAQGTGAASAASNTVTPFNIIPILNLLLDDML
jgi:hypothetical protein